MPSEFQIKGRAALQRVRQKIPNLGSLTALIHHKDPTADISSCAVTACVLAEVIDHGWFKSDLRTEHMTVQPTAPKSKKTGGGEWGAMKAGLAGLTGVNKDTEVCLRQEDRVEKIATLLGQPKVVVINVLPDHNFVVFPISDSDVVILQGFQGVYNLIDWMANASNECKISKLAFLVAMEMLVGASVNERFSAAFLLFAYDEHSRFEVGKYFKPASSVRIASIRHLGL